jgi:hypothetical protein
LVFKVSLRFLLIEVPLKTALHYLGVLQLVEKLLRSALVGQASAKKGNPHLKRQTRSSALLLNSAFSQQIPTPAPSPMQTVVSVCRVGDLKPRSGRNSLHSSERPGQDPFASALAVCGVLGISGCFCRTNNQVCVLSVPKCTRQLATS